MPGSPPQRWTARGRDGLRHAIGLVVSEADDHTAYMGFLCGESMDLFDNVEEGDEHVVTCLGCMAGESETAKLLRAKQQREDEQKHMAALMAMPLPAVSRATILREFDIDLAEEEPALQKERK